MASLYEYYNTYDDEFRSYGNGGAVWGSQTFTPATAHKITSVKVKIFRSETPGTLTVGIRAVDVNGHPTGADLCSGTTDADTLTDASPGEWREITLGAGYELADGTKYAIVCRVPVAAVGEWIRWRMDYTDGAYAGGNAQISSDSGASWTDYAGDDFMFEDWGEAIGVVGFSKGYIIG